MGMENEDFCSGYCGNTTCHVSEYSAPLLHVRKFSALCLPKIEAKNYPSQPSL